MPVQWRLKDFSQGGGKIEKFLVKRRARSARDFFLPPPEHFLPPPEHMLRGGQNLFRGGKKKQVFFSHIKGAKNAFSYEFDPPPEQNF